MHVLRPPNIETGEAALKIINEKYQDKDKLILNNSLIDAKWNPINITIKEADHPIMG